MIARPALDAVTDALRDVVEPREAMEILATRGLLPEGFDVEVIAPVMPRGAGGEPRPRVRAVMNGGGTPHTAEELDRVRAMLRGAL